jgi:hypothetical protein
MAYGWPAGGILAGLMPWLSLPDYARQTGTPESTVRAAIRKGTLEGHQEQRAPGDPRTVWKVWIDDPQEPSSEQPQASTAPETPQPQSTLTEPPAATTRLLDKLDERDETIRAKDAVIERLHAENATLHERAARAEAASYAAAHRAADLAERLRAAQRPWWRFWE